MTRNMIGVFLFLFLANAIGQQNPAAQAGLDTIRPTYVLGNGDQILIRANEVDEINEKRFTIEGDGFVVFPAAGRLKVSGLTVQELEAQLVERLKMFVRAPQVVVQVVQYRTEPVFFVGAFKSPGIYPLVGRRTLIEMLISVGGLQPNASRRLKVTRRLESGEILLPQAIQDSTANVSTAEITMASLRETVNPADDIELKPFDVISVQRTELVYINGEVGKVGGLELDERDSITVIQALTLAGGLSRDANPKQARILRPVLDTAMRTEIPIDLTKILEGQANDFPLLPNDVLYVPRAPSHPVWTFAKYAALPILTTVLILVFH
jgi:polysaccharide export outer membrane protein